MSTTKNIFNNPFEDINANVIDSKRIVEYWCDPFNLGILENFDEHKFCTNRIPIIVQGTRGSGKTTILKYFSFPAQIERAEINREKSVISRIKNEGEVGFYFRCEESFVSTFIAIFRSIKPENWTKLFECYLELVFCQKILDMVFVLIKRNEIQEFSSESVKNITNQSRIKFPDEYNTLQELYDAIRDEVIYFEQYKNQIIFTDEEFRPGLFVDVFSLSSAIVREIKNLIPAFKNTLFLLMIDEYENLDKELQKRFNSIIKFVKPDISIRIGRRSEGEFTTETVNDVEYLRENHDYYLATIGMEQNISIMKKYFVEIANLRFRINEPELLDDGKLDIMQILGDMENLDEECRNVCGNKKIHLDVILKQSKDLLNNDVLRAKVISIIKNDDNPIAETINALWVIRSKMNTFDAANYAVDSMNAYFNGYNSAGARKYKDDYSNKYRYAITVFLCSVYKKDKLYYGVNALSHLSNGNVRTYINFCQAIINDALFYEKKHFLKEGKISKKVQSHAIRNFSRSEFDGICSVVYSGNNIKRFILNLGNSFYAYHKDRKIRYPETTQCSFDKSSLCDEDRSIIQTAESWAILIKRQKVQRVSAGVEERSELFHMNKMFSPLFNMSYRIRGGVNLRLTTDEVHSMLYNDSYITSTVKKMIAGQELTEENFHQAKIENRQMSFFDMRDNNE